MLQIAAAMVCVCVCVHTCGVLRGDGTLRGNG